MEQLLMGSFLSAIATGAGALPILFFKTVTHRWRDILLAFTAGIMVAAATFSLIPQAMNNAPFQIVCLGVLTGTVTLTLLESIIPHIDLEHTRVNISMDSQALLILSAITLHNIPEGLSVGVSYSSEQPSLGGLIAFAIGLQNVPEGFLVALFLINQKVSKHKAFLLATLTGSVEIVSAIIGYSLTGVVEGLVPYGLSFAAGAMLFIVYKELIPESHGDGHARSATFSFIIGLLVMIGMIQWF
ncbi:ZIP family metal transporter [Brevibacillus reuszeri]|uniref:Dihydroorotate dehydrogenase n=1 Tax=Brevibacillus reuszeri TaxID=54915 RepID=A0A0K9Z0Y8_9BACL|nr:ZIP family metal transporter [Brevibacillus reuszeri]KNB74522.1 dihydroorotate dehydrogenase [Brevibacillus reuszeri]MED1856454.1 ZIP family metal transporter [Brevibacillus reuszeri]GED67850.1 ZIP family metal transporter [Brevibacillus reuszeri]